HFQSIDKERVGRRMALRELVLYTYATWGMDERDNDFKALLDDMLKDKLEATHCVALQAMALEEFDRVKYQKRIAQCAKFLVDNEAHRAYWHLGAPSIYVEDLDVSKKVGPLAVAGGKEQPRLRIKPAV